jgi:hypothetical protein
MRELARHSLEWNENTRTHIRILDREDFNQLGPAQRQIEVERYCCPGIICFTVR